MKNTVLVKQLLLFAVLGIAISGCAIEPVQSDRAPIIKGAPDWVNNGSMLSSRDGENIFVGVSSSGPKGDMALQKSIANDNSVTEVAIMLASYLDVIENDFMSSDRSSENGVSDERTIRQARDAVSQQIEDSATRNINEIVARQIDNAIVRQFKDTISKQLKDDIVKQVRKESMRNIKEAIWYQMEFSHDLEEVIGRQIKESVSRQVKSIGKPSMAHVKIIANWRDPNTNIIWSISELEIKHLKNAMATSADANLNLKKYFETNADLIFQRMIDEKENPSPYLFK